MIENATFLSQDIHVQAFVNRRQAAGKAERGDKGDRRLACVLICKRHRCQALHGRLDIAMHSPERDEIPTFSICSCRQTQAWFRHSQRHQEIFTRHFALPQSNDVSLKRRIVSICCTGSSTSSSYNFKRMFYAFYEAVNHGIYLLCDNQASAK